jgi:DNA-binding FadR family transcriptional regulator
VFDSADLRALLAAYQSVREENARMREGRNAIEDAIERASNWQHYARDWWDEDGAFHVVITPALDNIFDRARTGGTE